MHLRGEACGAEALPVFHEVTACFFAGWHEETLQSNGVKHFFLSLVMQVREKKKCIFAPACACCTKTITNISTRLLMQISFSSFGAYFQFKIRQNQLEIREKVARTMTEPKLLPSLHGKQPQCFPLNIVGIPGEVLCILVSLSPKIWLEKKSNKAADNI